MTSVTPAPAAALADSIAALLFTDCAAVLRGDISVTRAGDMSARGYTVQPVDDEGNCAAKSLGDVTIQIGTAPGKAGCRIRVAAPSAALVYEAVLQHLVERGFTFVGGHRARSEPQFVLDTLVSPGGDAGIVSMFRMNTAQATAFAMTLYPSPTQSRH